jgi:DNA-binding NarL/FixJ family response regulator
MATAAIVETSPTPAAVAIVPPLAPPKDGVVAKRKLNILLVEDDDADAYLIERALSLNPRVAGIVRACDGVEALELVDARKLRPDLAIVDLHMPRKNGLALLNELSARVMVDFPSVVLTSSKSRSDVQSSKQRGAMRFITKPSSMKRLIAALNRVVALI